MESSGSSQRWRHMRHQTLLGSDFLRIEPGGAFPNPVRYLEFELPASKLINFGSKTFFEVSGKFERQIDNPLAATDATLPAKIWRQCKSTDYSDFMLCPNWFDFLIQKCEWNVGNQSIQTHNLPDHLWPMLNTFLFYYMDKDIKDTYAPQPFHPARCMPEGKMWTVTTEKWKDYVQQLTADEDDSFKFQYYPLNFFPFCQNLNHAEQQPLPLSNFEKMFFD